MRNTFADFRAATRRGELWGNLRSIPVFRFLQFWGTYRGFAHDDTIPERLRRRFYYPEEDGYPDEPAEDTETEKAPTIDYSAVETDYPIENDTEIA